MLRFTFSLCRTSTFTPIVGKVSMFLSKRKKFSIVVFPAESNPTTAILNCFFCLNSLVKKLNQYFPSLMVTHLCLRHFINVLY